MRRLTTVVPCLAVAAVATALFAGVDAQAFAVEGPYWQADESGTPCARASASYPSGQVPCRIGVVTTGALNARTGWQTTTTYAADQWYTTDSNGVNFQYDVYSGANDVNVDAADLGGYDANQHIKLGYAYYNYYLPASMYYVSIQISTNSNVSWCVDATSSCPTSSTFDLEQVMTHELGHALGLAHPVAGPNSWALMQCITGMGEKTGEQTDDWNGVHYLYSTGSYGTPGGSPC